MKDFFRVAWLVVRKDLMVEARSLEVVSTTLFFALTVVLVFAFGLVREGRPVDDVAAAILWIATAFSGTLALGRTFERERQADTLRALMLAPKGDGPFPAALMLHDHGGKFDIGKEKVIAPWGDPVRVAASQAWADKYFSGRHLGDELARRGYVVLAVDARNVSRTLWTSEQAGTRDRLGLFARFVPPTVAGGKVFVATYGDDEPLGLYNPTVRPQRFPARYQVVVYGMIPDATPAIVNQSRNDVHLVSAEVAGPVTIDRGRCRAGDGQTLDCTAELARTAGAPARPCTS